MTRLQEKWEGNFGERDTRQIYEWARDEGELPSCYAVPGSFDFDMVPMVKPIFRALQDPTVREVVNMTGVQCLKTLIGELWLVWTIANNPGPTQWLQPTNEEAKEHAQERFIHLINSFHCVAKFYTENRHDKTTTFINFAHMSLRMEGCGRGNLQRKSIKNQMRSEVWQSDKWIPGRLKEADSRLTQFVHNSKTYTESQPGHDAELDVDDMHKAYLRGSQKVWNFKCQGCGRLQPYYWSFHRKDGTRAAMRWEDSPRTRRDNGEWRMGELIQTVRYECIYCGHSHADEPLTRRKMTAQGEFVSENPGAPHTVESFCYSQLAMPNLSWFETKIGGVKNFLEAHEQAKRGYDKPLIEFFQKVVAEPYNPNKHLAISRINTVEVVEKDGKPVEYQGITFPHAMMGVDVQADHFWLCVEAWSDKGDSVTMWAEKVFTWSDVRERQQRFNVPDQNVCVDQSHRGFEVIQECCRNGHVAMENGRKVWVCWKAMRGSDQDSFMFYPKSKKKGGGIPLPYTRPPQVGDPCNGLPAKDPRRAEFRGKYCALFTWSNPTIKDVVIARRDGRAKGIAHHVVKGEWNDEYARQMHSQKKVQVVGKYGGAKWKWERFRDDHILDCKCMNAVRAFTLNLLTPAA